MPATDTPATVVMNVTNALVQESVRAFYTGWYKELVTNLPQVKNGHVELPVGVGLGTELLPGLDQRDDATVVSST